MTKIKLIIFLRLADPDAVLTMLKWVEKQMNKRSPRLARSPRLGRSPTQCIHAQMSFEDEDDERPKTNHGLRAIVRKTAREALANKAV